jgi:cysteine synthase
VAAGVPDEIVLVKGEEAIETSLKLASMEGLFTGISGGASMAAVRASRAPRIATPTALTGPCACAGAQGG